MLDININTFKDLQALIDEILEAAQAHGDWAYTQGYMAAKNDIPYWELHKMREARKRMNEFEKLANSVKSLATCASNFK